MTNPLRAAQIITIGCWIALSSAAQDAPGSPGVGPDQDAISNAHALLIKAEGILEPGSKDFYKYTWSELALAAARAKDLDLAIRAANRSSKDSESIEKVALVLMKEGNKKEAYEILGVLAGGEPPVTPELVAFGMLIDSQVASGDIAGAQESLERMKKAAGPDPDHSYERDLQNAEEKIHAKEVGEPKLDLSAAPEKVKSIPDPLYRGQVRAILAVKEMEAGDKAASAEAPRLGELDLNQSKASMDKSGVHRGLILLAKVEARLGNVSKALEIAEHLPHNDAGAYLEARDSRTMALLFIVYEQARGGDVSGAFATAQRIQGEDAKFSTLEEIVKLQLSKHDNAGASQTCQRIFDLPAKPEFRNSLAYLEILLGTAERQNEAGASEVAKTNIARVIKEGRLLKGAGDRDRLSMEIAEAQVRLGDLDGAREELDQLTSERMEGLTLVAKAQAERKQFSDAIKTMAMAPAKCSQGEQPIPLCGLEDLPFRHVYRQFARLGDVEDAMTWANGITSPSDKAMALIAVAQGLLDRVSPDESEARKETDADSLRYWEDFVIGGIFGG